MQPLVDSDVLLYEVGFGCLVGWEGSDPPPFDRAMDMIDNKIAFICAQVEATHPPILFLTGKENFRYNIAKRTPYKERAGEKPFHYNNLKAYIKAKYDWRLVEGLEADDLMAIEQTNRSGETIICTRDKDLRQVGGWTYSWECGAQPSFGPYFIEGFGDIKLSNDRKKIVGYGDKFFYSQLLTGDPVDSIPGLPKCGSVKAFETLQATSTPREALQACYGAYKAFYGVFGAYREMLEQSRLLWMTRKLKRNGEPFLYGQINDYTREG